jgi:hypothetical protein
MVKYNRLLAIRHYQKLKSFRDTSRYQPDRIHSAGSELTLLPLFHMVHPGSRVCRRAILTAKELAVQWKNTAMFS